MHSKPEETEAVVCAGAYPKPLDLLNAADLSGDAEPLGDDEEGAETKRDGVTSTLRSQGVLGGARNLPRPELLLQPREDDDVPSTVPAPPLYGMAVNEGEDSSLEREAPEDYDGD